MRVFIFLILLISSLSARDNKIALLIANQDYENYPRLDTPINDIKAMKKLLEKKGFRTIVLHNGRKREIERKLHEFKSEAYRSRIALVYYSGHGMTIEGKNYLISIDAPKAEYESSRYELIPLDEITDIASHAKSSIILLDASRDIPLLSKFQKGLVPIQNIELNSIVAFSTSTSKTSNDRNDNPWIQILLKNLEEATNIRSILNQVKEDLRSTTQGRYVPYIQDSLSRKIYLDDDYDLSNIYSGLPTSIKVEKHGHIKISKLEDIKELKNMLTYVLFPDVLNKNSKKYKRYEKVLELIQTIREYDLNVSSYPNAKEINQFILMKKKEIELERITVDSYNYRLSNKIIDILWDKTEEIKLFKSVLQKKGPLLITTTDNILSDNNISALVVDLSSFNNSAIDEIINSYKKRLIDTGNSKFTMLEKLKFIILSLVTNANDNIYIVRQAIAGEL